MADFLDQNDGDLVTWWKNDFTLQGYFGTGNNFRVYNGQAKQVAIKPYAVYLPDGGDHDLHHGGAVALRRSNVRLFVFSDKESEARAAVNYIHDKMHGMPKQVIPDSYGTWIDLCVASAPVDNIDRPYQGADEAKFDSMIVLEITHSQ